MIWTGISALLFAACLIVLVKARKEGRLASLRFRNAGRRFEEAEKLVEEARKRTGGEITVRHLREPVLGPRKFLVVMLPDPSWEVITEMKSPDPVTIVADTKEALDAYGESDYVIGIYPQNGHVVIGKWREWPAEAIEVTAFGAE